tara:strand:+ start:11363 stop:11662 length:300 start_codon:yes stop_codon:yes gene_type:complete
MAKIGVNLKINVAKIDKSKLFHGKNGAIYLDATAFIDLDNVGEYGDNGMITQSKKKDDTENGNILGNSKIFWRDEQKPNNLDNDKLDNTNIVDDSDIPF